ncbi:hypothetical protein Tco_0814142 [Tanacetum coccineum]
MLLGINLLLLLKVNTARHNLVLPVKDEDGKEVDVHMYRSMIGSLMYLTSSRPDIMFAVCACARYQVNPKVSHLYAVKRIFRYLKCQPKLGLWYPKDSPFDLVAYTDSDYAGASLDRKSTTGGCQFLGSRLISWQCKKQTVVANSITEAEYVAALSCCGQVLWIRNQLLNYGPSGWKEDHHYWSIVRRVLQLEDVDGVDCLPNATIFEQLTLMGSKRKDTEVPQPSGPTTNVANEYVNEEMDDSLEMAATTATGLEAEQDSGSGPRRQETMGDTIAQTRSENVSKLSNDPLLVRGNTLQSGEDRLKLEKPRRPKRKDTEVPQPSGPTTNVADEAVNEEMDDSLERAATTATSLDAERPVVSSSRRVESSDEEGLGEEDASKQGRIADIDANKDIYLVNVHGPDERYFDVNDLDGDEVIVNNEYVVKTAKETRSVVEEVTTIIEKAKLVSAAEETINAAATTASTILVRIYQKSQENSQKRASTNTRTEECTKARSKAKEKSILSQKVKEKSTHGQQNSITRRQNPK